MSEKISIPEGFQSKIFRVNAGGEFYANNFWTLIPVDLEEVARNLGTNVDAVRRKIDNIIGDDVFVTVDKSRGDENAKVVKIRPYEESVRNNFEEQEIF